jgi:hypothetical protein
MTIGISMTVGQLLTAALMKSTTRFHDLHKSWIKISHRLGSLLPDSLLVVSAQRAGDLDLIVRSLEEDTATQKKDPDESDLIETNIKMMYSEIWVGAIYDIVRLMKDRDSSPEPNLVTLYRQLNLVRVPLVKHEIAKERKLKVPLLLKKLPSTDSSSDYYNYSKTDLQRAHIMQVGISERGSVVWRTLDVETNEEFWIERRALSDSFLSLWDAN